MKVTVVAQLSSMSEIHIYVHVNLQIDMGESFAFFSYLQ